MSEVKVHPAIKEYLSTKKVLLVESSDAGRNTISQILSKLGVPPTNMMTMKDIQKAIPMIGQRRPNIVITELFQGPHSGLELAKLQKEFIKNSSERLFVVIASGASDGAVAEAAEEEVDSYLVKPFAPAQFIQYLIKQVAQKIKPSEYQVALAGGLSKFEHDLEGSLVDFERAVELTPRPTLAYCYIADVHLKLEKPDLAKASLLKALELNPLHFRALRTLTDCELLLSNPEAAYQCLKKISESFPISQQRLMQLVGLALTTENTVDVKGYYEIFKKLEERTEETVTAMASALVQCGQSYFFKQQEQEAHECFEAAVSVSARDKLTLAPIVQFYIDQERGTDAEKYLLKFKPTDQKGEEYINLDFEVSSRTLEPTKLVDRGRNLIRSGEASPKVYIATITALKSLNRIQAAEDILFEARKKHPEQIEEFNKLLAS